MATQGTTQAELSEDDKAVLMSIVEDPRITQKEMKRYYKACWHQSKRTLGSDGKEKDLTEPDLRQQKRKQECSWLKIIKRL